jgi:hypothetical protein
MVGNLEIVIMIGFRVVEYSSLQIISKINIRSNLVEL